MPSRWNRLAADAVRIWRKATPRITGILRASEVAVIINDPARGRYGVRFRVRQPGSIYYTRVAGHHPKLRGLAVVYKWLDVNALVYADRAIDRALATP